MNRQSEKMTGAQLDRLFAVIESRRGGDPHASYTAQLLSAGTAKMARKLGEETTETVIAALDGTPEQVISESADLLYHLLVLWAGLEIKPELVWEELAGRESQSGLEEKQSRRD